MRKVSVKRLEELLASWLGPHRPTVVAVAAVGGGLIVLATVLAKVSNGPSFAALACGALLGSAAPILLGALDDESAPLGRMGSLQRLSLSVAMGTIAGLGVWAAGAAASNAPSDVALVIGAAVGGAGAVRIARTLESRAAVLTFETSSGEKMTTPAPTAGNVTVSPAPDGQGIMFRPSR
jgi:hypothetical protein